MGAHCGPDPPSGSNPSRGEKCGRRPILQETPKALVERLRCFGAQRENSSFAEGENVELGGIEPPSVKESPHVLRPFPRYRCCGHRVAGSTAHYESEHDHIVFPTCQGSLPPVNGLSHCPPLLLLPGCSGQTPRDLTARSFPLYYLIRLGGKSEVSLIGASIKPCLTSLSNSGRIYDFSSRRRNRSAPCFEETLNHTSDRGRR